MSGLRADHLGNVRAVVAKNAGNLEVRVYSDYYPFGTVIQTGGTNYRYQYQGQYSEKEAETDWNAFELRMYDSRIARWLSVDPKGEFHSPYLAMGNDPIKTTDPDGGSTDDIIVRDTKGNNLFALDDGNPCKITYKTTKELYSKGIQWSEPSADNFMALKWTNPNISSFETLKHFSWNDIASFANKDRWMSSYRQGGSGDWKQSKSGADGFYMSTVDGVPYWSDAIGQIPFAVDYFTDMFKKSGNINQSIMQTISSARKYGEGRLFGGTPEGGNIYDIYFILRGALYASHAYTVPPGGGDLKQNMSYPASSLGSPITPNQAKFFRLK